MYSFKKFNFKIAKAQNVPKIVGLHAWFKLTLSALSLVSNGNMELAHRRREYIRPDLYSYRELCSSNTPITDLLFGDDVAHVV